MGMKYDRQIGILNYLLASTRTTVWTLAREFDVSKQTIKRDIYELSYHFPITTYQGKYGGIEISKAFILNGQIIKSKQMDIIAEALDLLYSEKHDSDVERLIHMLLPRKKACKASYSVLNTAKISK